MRSGHIKVKKGTRHLFYMAIPPHTTESVLSFLHLTTMEALVTTHIKSNVQTDNCSVTLIKVVQFPVWEAHAT